MIVYFGLDGTATAGRDYTATPTESVTIPAGSTTATITIDPIDDDLEEGDETVIAFLPGPWWYDLEYDVGPDSMATVVIADDFSDSVPEVSIVASDPEAAEAGLDPGQFTVSRTGSLSEDLIVSYEVSGTATTSKDYDSLSGVVTIPAGSASATIGVAPLDDLLAELDEPVVATLTASGAYAVGAKGSDTVTIMDDEPVVTLDATDPDAAEMCEDPGEFTVTRTGPTTDDLIVNYEVSGTATPDEDYVALTGSVTIPAGASSAYITVNPIDDDWAEGDETVIATLTESSAYLIGLPGEDTVTIADDLDDPYPLVGIAASDPEAAESPLDTGTFTVYRTGSTDSALAVYFSLDGTATETKDYAAIPSTFVIIPVGKESADITIVPVDDQEQEWDETVVATLLPNAAYVIGIGSDTVAIKDNEKSCSDVAIAAEMIDQDDPTNKTWAPAESVLYSGSTSFTADNLKLEAVLGPNPPAVQTYAWSVTGRDSIAYQPPGNNPFWNVGDIQSLPAAGIDSLRFRAAVTFVGGGQCVAQKTFEIGIRTDDIVIVGWINPRLVTLPPPVINGHILRMFPRNGTWPWHDVDWRYIDAPAYLSLLSKFTVEPNIFPVVQVPLDAKNRQYILNWLFKYGGNPNPPPKDFLTNGIIDYDKVNAYAANRTQYKLFNHFQVKYRVQRRNGRYDVFNGLPQPLNDDSTTQVGITIDPIAGLKFPGQVGRQSGQKTTTLPDGSVSAISLINDGSPDNKGINVTNELLGDPRHLIQGQAPRFWENIGSRIEFSPRHLTNGLQFVQPYPTYWVYINGRFAYKADQKPEPSDHFYPHANNRGTYPFGTRPSSGEGGQIPGGRNGDATSAPDPTSWVPPNGVYYDPATGQFP